MLTILNKTRFIFRVKGQPNTISKGYFKTADSTHCFFHLVRFPNARRFNLSRDTVDCQINIPISIYYNLAFNNCEILLEKNPTNSIVYSQGARIGIYCFGLNSKIWKLVNTRGVRVSFEPFTPMEFLCHSASGPRSHIENQDVRS